MIRRPTRPTAAGFLALLILLVVFGIHSAQPADAHAILESSSPADQSVLEGSPARVLLTFSEPVTLVTGAIRVFDASGDRVDSGLASHAGSPAQVAIALKPNLPSGSYAVAWRVISADTHPVHGGFTFSVHSAGRVAGLDSLIAQSSQPGYEAAGAVLRALGYLGSFIVAGVAVFVAFVRRRRVGPRAAGFLDIITAVTVLAMVAQLPVSAALATGEGLGSLFSAGVLRDVLGQGTALTIAGVALSAIAGLVAVLRHGDDRRWFAIASTVLLAAAFVLSGHTRTTDPTWLVSIVDAIHVAAGAIWVGGVFALAWTLRRRPGPPGDPVAAAGEVAGFSAIATYTIVAVSAAGAVLAFIEIGSWHGLFSTGYGRLVLAKIALLAILVALGGFNRFRLVPVIDRRPDRPAAWRYLRRTVLLEAVALVGVLGVTGVLVNAVPARTIAAESTVYSSTAKLGSGSINLVIDPARTGPTALHLYLLDEHGRPDNDEESVEIQLTQEKLGIGPVTHELRRAGPGHFVENGTLFTVPGDWQIVMRVRVDEFTENSAVLSAHIAS